jgi:hypothetical protein
MDVRQAVAMYGSIKNASMELGIPQSTMQRRHQLAVSQYGSFSVSPRKSFELPKKGKVSRYIFTCAQNNTRVNNKVWEGLKELARYRNASICVSTFTYNKSAYSEGSVKRGKAARKEKIWYDPAIEPYVLDESMYVTPTLVWCGELNILPTAVRPLSGFESYTGSASGIFPHTKIALASVASGKKGHAKLNYTTGTVTLKNYIAKTAGFKADFHHVFGGLMVEVDHAGHWYCRQLNADKKGIIYDLDVRVENGKIARNLRVEAINWGDIHQGTIDPDNQRVMEQMQKQLKPRFQFFHDVLNFKSRNHHDRNNIHLNFKKWLDKQESVSEELYSVGKWLIQQEKNSPKDCKLVVVKSNHDNAFERWLREGDYRNDPQNAVFFLAAQLSLYTALEAKDKDFHLLGQTLKTMMGGLGNVRFLKQDESFIICGKSSSGIECGYHGHLGANGGMGSLKTYAKTGSKFNLGHLHSVGVEDGAYQAGVTGSLYQGYNKGLSSWSHGHIVTYPNGKRTIINVWEGKWRA